MVPDKFNMVDMGGIDLIMMQGGEVPGLYNRLVESIAQCHYQCLYNWLFDGIIIPPTYVEMEVNEDDEIVINEGVTVSPDDVIHIYSIESGSVINPISITENGVYNVPLGVDGFNPVTVNVPIGAPIISIDYWNSLTIEEKHSLGNIVIQDSYSGYKLGEYVNAALYTPPITLVDFYHKNAATSSYLEHIFDESNEYTIIVAFVQAGNISDVSVKLDNIDVNMTEFYSSTYAHLYSANINASEDSILTVQQVTPRANVGVQLIILKNVGSVECSGSAPNAASGITLAGLTNVDDRYLMVLKYGYYSGAATMPTVDLFFTDELFTTPAIGSENPYWYGGQYVLLLSH